MTSYQEFIIQLPKRTFDEIDHLVPKVRCPLDQVLIYEGQTPIVAYILFSGRIRISKKRSRLDLNQPYSLIGVREFLNSSSFPYTLTVEQGSIVGYLDRSTLQMLLEERVGEFSDCLDQVLAR